MCLLKVTNQHLFGLLQIEQPWQKSAKRRTPWATLLCELRFGGVRRCSGK